jgi:hypothetical protein
MSQWVDEQTGRRIWVLDADSAGSWPEAVPWVSSKFAVLLLAEHVFDVTPLARRALGQGMVWVSTWGPGCEAIDEDLDEIIAQVQTDGRADEVVITTTHPEESLEEAIEFFLAVARPARAHVEECRAWVVVGIGAAFEGRVARALGKRGARAAS